MKNFNISCLDDFFLDESMEIDNILTMADKQIIIKHAVDSIRANEYEKHLPGNESVQLYHGQSIIAACLEEGLVVNIYSLRDTVKSILASIRYFACNFNTYYFVVIRNSKKNLAQHGIRAVIGRNDNQSRRYASISARALEFILHLLVI